jgi:hypothetical protein
MAEPWFDAMQWAWLPASGLMLAIMPVLKLLK